MLFKSNSVPLKALKVTFITDKRAGRDIAARGVEEMSYVQNYFQEREKEKKESALSKECEGRKGEEILEERTGPETASQSRVSTTARCYAHSGHVLSRWNGDGWKSRS